MIIWQKFLLILLAVYSIVGFIKGLRESKNKKNPFGETKFFTPLGAFVWGDMVIFGVFWWLISLVILYLNDWILFLLIFSVFWTVRSFGETTYWFLQQFSVVNRNPPEKFWHFKIFKNDSVWFVNQIFWQCVTTVSLISTIYLAKIWFQ